jgi:hypothetical protein
MEKTGTFGATGQSAIIAARRITLDISGTFVGTVQPETYLNGAWVSEGAAQTAPATTEYTFVTPRPFRLNCTVYTSGTIAYSMEYEG